MLTLGIIASLAYASLRPRQVAGEIVGVATIGGPPTAAIAAVSAAGGEILRDGNFTNSVIARAPDAGFVGRLHAAGVHLVYRVDRDINCAAIAEAVARNAVAPIPSERSRPRLAILVAGGG